MFKSTTQYWAEMTVPLKFIETIEMEPSYKVTLVKFAGGAIQFRT